MNNRNTRIMPPLHSSAGVLSPLQGLGEFWAGQTSTETAFRFSGSRQRFGDAGGILAHCCVAVPFARLVGNNSKRLYVAYTTMRHLCR